MCHGSDAAQRRRSHVDNIWARKFYVLGIYRLFKLHKCHFLFGWTIFGRWVRVNKVSRNIEQCISSAPKACIRLGLKNCM